ncbi:MAG: hypothetical protein FWF20_01210 [Betaproteobacteria bacterium]|nr:hypothetical protein [Betaproteobacteria bacterium]MCL2885400.1 hypothetical protein [Betaproteobacteria bacterium]
MKPFLLLPVLAAIALPAAADDTAGGAAIVSLGQINGVALACQQMAIASRARHAVQDIAQKTRSNGEIFEEATSAAFLDQGKGLECPDVATLNTRLGEAEQQLRQAFPPAP